VGLSKIKLLFFLGYYDALAAKVSNVSLLNVRQFSQGINDMVNDTSGLSDNILNRLLFKPQMLNSHDHNAAVPSYFDVSLCNTHQIILYA